MTEPIVIFILFYFFISSPHYNFNVNASLHFLHYEFIIDLFAYIQTAKNIQALPEAS